MVIERFKNTQLVHQRFLEKGRMMPAGLSYVDSWIEEDFSSCFQLMECGDRSLMDEWINRWADLVDFEVIAVTPSTIAWQSFTSQTHAERF